MAIVLQEETIQHTVTKVERTSAVNLNTNAAKDSGDYTMDIVRDVAEYKDGALQSTNRTSIPATTTHGGYESEIHMTVAELMKRPEKIVMEDGREIPLTDLLEIISKGCDIISDIRREERRLAAVSQL